MEASNMGKKLWEASKITGEALGKAGDRNQEYQKKEKNQEKPVIGIKDIRRQRRVAFTE